MTVLAHVVKPVGLCQLLVEPLDQESGGLPRGVQTVCSVAGADKSCVQGGVIPVQVLNLNEEDIWLQPKGVLGTIQELDVLEPHNRITEVGLNDIIIQSACAEDSVNCEGEGPSGRTGSTKSGVDSLPSVDLGGLDLSDEELQRVRMLLVKHKDVFSKDENDIGYCDVVLHQIVTLDDRPVRVPHRRVHPNQWE